MEAESNIEHLIKQSILRLLDYCKKNNWAGFDPYDALNSRVFAALPFVQNRIGKLIFTQAMKRSPVNFRPLFLVPKGQNPKGLALFCSALIKISSLGLRVAEAAILPVLNRLIELKSPNRGYYCWGYNFDWQTRSLLVPKYTPNIICTTFSGNALLDAYEKYGNPDFLKFALSAGHFIINSLNGTDNGDEICFSYTPLEAERVHNANLLGAAFLARLYSISGDDLFIERSLLALRYSIRRQNDDGSWPYAEHARAKWIDNFHTGYNLVSLKKFYFYTHKREFLPNLKKGLDFYLNNLFTRDGIPKYYDNRTHPIDVHSIAQSIITLLELKKWIKDSVGSALAIFRWAFTNMRAREGYFYYQKMSFIKNRTPYMRWSQAWMLYALATLAENTLPELWEFKR